MTEKQQIIEKTEDIFDELYKNICKYYNNNEYDKMFLAVDKAKCEIKDIIIKDIK